MIHLLVSLTYLIATGIRLYENSPDHILPLAGMLLLFTAIIALATWSGFILRSGPEDWNIVRDRLQQPIESLSPLQIKEAEATVSQARHCLYTAGMVVSLIFWRILCEERNPFALPSSSDLPLGVPAIIPLLPVLLLGDWLNRLTRKFNPTSAEVPTGFWQTNLLLLIMVLSILGNLRHGSGDEDMDIFLMAAVLSVPLLVLSSRAIYKRLTENT